MLVADDKKVVNVVDAYKRPYTPISLAGSHLRRRLMLVGKGIYLSSSLQLYTLEAFATCSAQTWQSYLCYQLFTPNGVVNVS